MSRHFLRDVRSLSTLSVSIHRSAQANLFLCNKRIQELSQLGHVEEARQLFDRMSERDAVSWNSMITGYSQNGRLYEARLLFDKFAGKNVRTWTTLLSGYAKHGCVEEAQTLFASMPERNVVSWNAMISGCVQNGDLDNAIRLFDEMPERNMASWNSIITGYCHCCRMKEARELFDLMNEKNIVSYAVIISGYVEISEYREAWDVFLMMHKSGLTGDQSIFVVVLSAISGLDELMLIESLRTLVLKTGCEVDVVVNTAILNAYTRNGCLDSALRFFEMMPTRNEYSWTTMIAALSQCQRLVDAIALYKRVPEQTVATQTTMMAVYAQYGRIHEAKLLFEGIQNPNVVTWNAMVAGYAQNGMLEEAKDIFVRMPLRNAASWAAMISGLAKNGQNKEALQIFAELHQSGALPSHSSFTSALFACANIGAVEIGRQIHSLAIKTRCQLISYVGNGLISMYAKCKNMEDVSWAFSTMKVRDAVSWNSLITSLSENNMLEDARNTFEKMPIRDVVSWTSMISAYEQAGQADVALVLFIDMLSTGMKPNQLTVTSLLSACASLGITKLGELIHGLIFKLGFDSCLFVCNALITMYFKCGCPDGLSVFEEMSARDIVTWNAVLAGCAQNGLGKKAIKIFEQMETEGVLPDQISFLGILCACSHAGLIDNGWIYFNSMIQDYGITPLIHHYTCMVDLLGRAGWLSEAEALIEKMPEKPDNVIWEALLAACRIHRNIEVGQRVAERIFYIGTKKSGTYILLSNMYASQGMWDKVEEIRQLMKGRGVTKEPAASWIQIRNKLHCFVMGDETHNQIEEIHLALNEFYGLFRATGYMPDTNFVLHDLEEERK
ncbi:pentatricopeptide repeat-containing protein At4g02750-like [Malania oleifera]|uniref:pentatricopeptide repeat-containing protein At4g02750-like n=1 Tax=Malania oleifera TaxID=397392 RepID=UPI0025AE8249|nr:pentatricopeptide repeat-containing protein At4g02750-like [Malania oleifera]